METYWLCFTLLSDATFGRGEGVAGLVDQEIEHDVTGLPLLRGRTLKGLLNEACADVLFSLSRQGQPLQPWERAAHHLFGGPGNTVGDTGGVRFGPACPPAKLREAVKAAVSGRDSTVDATDIVQSLTTLRHQTAVDSQTGTPEEHTLRTMRVILRGTMFEARITFEDGAEAHDLALLAASVMGLQRAGTGRNRGRGRLQAFLFSDAEGRPGTDVTLMHFADFQKEVTLCMS